MSGQEDVTGRAWTAMRGPFIGVVIRVVGREGEPERDIWNVTIEGMAKWPMTGEQIRSALRESEVTE